MSAGLQAYVQANGASGGASAATEVTSGTSDPVGAPATTDAIYYNKTTGKFFVWDNTALAWVPLIQ